LVFPQLGTYFIFKYGKKPSAFEDMLYF